MMLCTMFGMTFSNTNSRTHGQHTYTHARSYLHNRFIWQLPVFRLGIVKLTSRIHQVQFVSICEMNSIFCCRKILTKVPTFLKFSLVHFFNRKYLFVSWKFIWNWCERSWFVHFVRSKQFVELCLYWWRRKQQHAVATHIYTCVKWDWLMSCTLQVNKTWKAARWKCHHFLADRFQLIFYCIYFHLIICAPFRLQSSIKTRLLWKITNVS